MIGEIYEFKLRAIYDSYQECLNVFHYQSRGEVDVTSSLADVAAALWTHIGANIKYVTTGTVIYQTVEVLRPRDLAIGSYTISSGAGVIGGQSLPPHDCFAFRYNRATATTRHGHKRFAGVSENIQSSGIVIDSEALTNLGNLATKLYDSLSSVDGLNTGAELAPVIYSKFLNGELRPTPVINQVSSVQYVRISSQNTRKVYR